MKCIAVVNEKGGTGKSTTAINFAAGIARQLGPDQVLVIDTDPQANLSSTFLGPAMGAERRQAGVFTIYDLYQKTCSIDDVIYQRDLEAVPYYPASQLDVIPSVGELRDLDPTLNAGLENLFILQEALQSLNDRYQVVIIDCPGIFSSFTMSSMLACDYLLVPIPPGRFEVEGLRRMIAHIDSIKKRFNSALHIAGIMPIRTDRTLVSKNFVEDIAAFFSEELILPSIDERVAVKEANLAGEDIFTYAPDSPSAAQFVDAIDTFATRLGLWKGDNSG